MRRVSILVCTYGSDEWAKRGAETAAQTHQAGADVLAVHDGGASLAEVRNAAAAETVGDWLCFLDADDELAPGYLDAMRQAWMAGAITTDWAPLLVPAIQYVRSWGPEAKSEIPSWDTSIYDLNCACIGTLVPRARFLAAGGFGGDPIYEDWATWLKLVAAGAQLVPVRDAVYRYHIDAGSLRNQQTLETRTATYHAIRRRFSHVPAAVWESAKGR